MPKQTIQDSFKCAYERSAIYADARTLWAFHQTCCPLRSTDAAIGLGSHDVGVADAAVQLLLDGLVPKIVFTGANSAGTLNVFPEGEAVAYRNRAIDLGVPEGRILLEDRARNTGQNIQYSRLLLERMGESVAAVTLVTKPYMQRRALATCKSVWPDVDVVCHSERIGFLRYLSLMGDDRLVIDLMVGDLQRLRMYPAKGFSVAQEIPDSVLDAAQRLEGRGFTSNLLR